MSAPTLDRAPSPDDDANRPIMFPPGFFDDDSGLDDQGTKDDFLHPTEIDYSGLETAPNQKPTRIQELLGKVSTNLYASRTPLEDLGVNPLAAQYVAQALARQAELSAMPMDQREIA